MPGNISAPSLLAGEVQFGQMTGALMSPVRLQGGDPVMLVSIQELLDDRLLARPNITKPEELRAAHRDLSLRRRISYAGAQHAAPIRSQRERCDVFGRSATPRRGSSPWSATRRMLQAFSADHLAPQLTGMRTLLNMAELNIYYQGTGLVATQRYIAKNATSSDAW